MSSVYFGRGRGGGREGLKQGRDKIPARHMLRHPLTTPTHAPQIAKFTVNPDFTPESVGKVSLAAKGMCMWVRAMEVYGSVAKEVGPKRARLKAAQENLARKQAALAAAQEALAAVLAKVASLRCVCVEEGGQGLVLKGRQPC